MPRSPCQLTIASFLKKAPNILPQDGKGKRRGKKRTLSVSPTSANLIPSKKLNDLSPATVPQSQPAGTGSPSSPHEPRGNGKKTSTPPTLLPYQLRSSPNNPGTKRQTKSRAKYAAMKISPSRSSMDLNPFEMSQGDDFSDAELPTPEEAEEMLKETDLNASPSAPKETTLLDSPTAAVKSAIEAEISENLEPSYDTMYSEIICNKDNDKIVPPTPTLVPFVAPRKLPQPLFPEGLPPHLVPNKNPLSSGKPRGYFTDGGPEATLSKDSTKPMPKDSTKPKPSYASKAKSPPKPRDHVQNILYVYSTKITKKPLSFEDWTVVDNHLIERLNAQHPDDPTLVRIANSGYDKAHKCGFIACRDQASEAWVKAALRITIFRAWSKGEQPEVRLCRLFFPARFDCLHDDRLIPLLRKHNPPLGQASLTLKSSDQVQGGRAIFMEMDAASYGYAKSKNHKLEFSMMDIDCQLYIPPPKKTTKLDGITKLPPNPVVRPSASSSNTLAPTPNGKTPVANSAAQPLASSPCTATMAVDPSGLATSTPNNDKLVQSFSQKFEEERKKRARPIEQKFPDASKKLSQ